MKTVFAMLSAVVLASSITASPTLAMPRLDAPTTAAPAAPSIEKTRLVCNYRRCWHVGGYRYYGYYRPYRYYRPYYYAPHIGVGVGPFGVRIF